MNYFQGRKLTRIKTPHSNKHTQSNSDIFMGGQRIIFASQLDMKLSNLPPMVRNKAASQSSQLLPNIIMSRQDSSPSTIPLLAGQSFAGSPTSTKFKHLGLNMLSRPTILIPVKGPVTPQPSLGNTKDYFLTPQLQHAKYHRKLKGIKQQNTTSGQFDDTEWIMTPPKKFVRTFNTPKQLLTPQPTAPPNFETISPLRLPQKFYDLYSDPIDEEAEQDNETHHALTLKKSSKLTCSSPGSDYSKNSILKINDPHVSLQRLQPRDSLKSSFTYDESNQTENEEEYDVWDNGKDVRVATAVNDQLIEKSEIQQFLKFYKMRYGGFPGLPQTISNEQVIEVAVKFATQNKRLFRKYFPDKQVEFDDSHDYSKPYDQSNDTNFHQFEQFCSEMNPNQGSRRPKHGNRGSLNQKSIIHKQSQFAQLNTLDVSPKNRSLSPRKGLSESPQHQN